MHMINVVSLSSPLSPQTLQLIKCLKLVQENAKMRSQAPWI